MFCPNCKKEIDDDSKFCEFCGNKAKTDEGHSELIEKILNEKKSPEKEIVLSAPEQLNKKMWYRALKVLYIVGIIVGIILSIGIAIDNGEISAFVIITLLTLIIAEIFKRSFYYIYLGKIFP